MKLDTCWIEEIKKTAETEEIKQKTLYKVAIVTSSLFIYKLRFVKVCRQQVTDKKKNSVITNKLESSYPRFLTAVYL